MARPTVTRISARDRIAEAALRLFTSEGYGATTIEGIAKEAGVGISTVYAVYGNKREIVAELRRQWIDKADVEALVAEAMRAVDPHQKLRLCARWIRRQMEFGQPVISLIQEAARTDPQVNRYLTAIRRKPRAKIAELAASLGPSLVASMTPKDAEAVIWVFSQSGVYREFIHQWGWSPDRYEAWLSDALQYQLLGHATGPG